LFEPKKVGDPKKKEGGKERKEVEKQIRKKGFPSRRGFTIKIHFVQLNQSSVLGKTFPKCFFRDFHKRGLTRRNWSLG
jgi:hypothetical protein